MKRRQNWLTAMWQAFEDWQFAEFAWGRHDCCLFCARVVDAITGAKFEDNLLTCYFDKRSAIDFLKKRGGLELAVSAFIGQSQSGRPKRGDVVLFSGPKGKTLGIADGLRIVTVGRVGLVSLPMGNVIKYWSI